MIKINNKGYQSDWISGKDKTDEVSLNYLDK